MPATGPIPVLTKSQAACLKALRDGEKSKTYVATHAKLGLKKANAALLVLEELGLARRSEMKTWRTTPRGQKCRFKTTAEKSPIRAELGPGLQRVLDALDRPMRGRDLAKKLGVTIQCVQSHVVALYARGHVRLGCPDQILFVVARIDDDTPLLSLHEERVLSAIPNDCATSIAKIRLAARLSATTSAANPQPSDRARLHSTGAWPRRRQPSTPSPQPEALIRNEARDPAKRNCRPCRFDPIAYFRYCPQSMNCAPCASQTSAIACAYRRIRSERSCSTSNGKKWCAKKTKVTRHHIH